MLPLILAVLVCCVAAQEAQQEVAFVGPPPPPVFKKCLQQRNKLSLPFSLSHDQECWEQIELAVARQFASGAVAFPEVPEEVIEAQQKGEAPSEEIEALIEEHVQAVQEASREAAQLSCVEIKTTLEKLESAGSDCCNLMCHCDAIENNVDVEQLTTCGGMVPLQRLINLAEKAASESGLILI